MRHLIHLVKIALVTLLVADDEDVGERHDITIHVDIGRILYTCHSVDVEGIAVHFRSELVGGIAPHAILSFFQLSDTWGIILAIARNIYLLSRQEVTSHFYLHCLRGKEIKCHCTVVIDDG